MKRKLQLMAFADNCNWLEQPMRRIERIATDNCDCGEPLIR